LHWFNVNGIGYLDLIPNRCACLARQTGSRDCSPVSLRLPGSADRLSGLAARDMRNSKIQGFTGLRVDELKGSSVEELIL